MKQIMIVGNVGSEPRSFSYTTKDGAAKTAYNISIAVKGRRGNDEWMKVLAFEGLKNVAQYIHKGTQLTVVGEPRCELYTKRDGTPGACISIVANNITLPQKPKLTTNPATAPAIGEDGFDPEPGEEDPTLPY